jgi:hypothetical protein
LRNLNSAADVRDALLIAFFSLKVNYSQLQTNWTGDRMEPPAAVILGGEVVTYQDTEEAGRIWNQIYDLMKGFRDALAIFKQRNPNVPLSIPKLPTDPRNIWPPHV